MYKYEITHHRYNKHFKFKPSQFEEVINLMDFCLKHKKSDTEIKFFLKGSPSTAEEMLQSAHADKGAYWEKKKQTHKKVWVGTGVTNFVKKPIWIKK
jgi:hypothetical protein